MRLIILLLALPLFASAQKFVVQGVVLDADSTSPLPFAYVINKNAGHGVPTNEQGRFALHASVGDTISVSYLGFYNRSIAVDSAAKRASISFFMQSKTQRLKPAMVFSTGWSKESKEIYASRIGEYQRGMDAPLASPITALYYAFSKRGKQLQKLSELYQQLLIDEIKESRLPPDLLRSVTGDPNLNTRDFLNYCFLPNSYVINANDYELLVAVKNCYKAYKMNREINQIK